MMSQKQSARAIRNFISPFYICLILVSFICSDLIYNPDIASSARDIFTIDEKPFKVEKIDAYTVKFTLPVRFAPFLRGMGQAILPKHKLQKYVEEKKFNTAWGLDTKPQD